MTHQAYSYYRQHPEAGALAPQGFFGDLLGTIAPIAGTVAGGVFGAPMIGGAIGGLAGNAARMLPFSAAPQLPPEMVPQGFFGDLVGQLAPIAGGALGQWAGNQQLGRQLGGMAGQLGRQFIPFSAAPQLPPEMAPQGFFGDLVGQLAPIAGGALGQWAGNQQLGRQLGGMAGQLGRQFIPFSAAPQLPPEMAPQGFFGDLAGQLAPIAGGAIGQWAGNRQLGQQIGNIAGQVGRQFIPFSAAPQLPPEMAPQGFFGDLTSLGPIAQWAGNPQLGQQVCGINPQVGRQFIPFNAAPQAPGYWM